ncbi:MAG: sigma-54 dependent transcriptional regulator [Longimicrobiales bacterium]|nr:sigma-54 dependent transcriptional regulator [Longimicrobiales bacterium]
MSTEVRDQRILLVEDDDSFRRALTEVLAARGYDVEPCSAAPEALERLQEDPVDLVVTDVVMPGMRGDALIREIRETFPHVPAIAITAFGSIEDAVEITRAGAADYLTKPFRTRALLDAMDRILSETRDQRERAQARRSVARGAHLDNIVGSSPPMLRLYDRIDRIAPSPAPALVVGETGTGKELVARAIHQASGRGAFVPVNCGAIPDALLESELFGHEKGAFTGAQQRKAGLMEAAHEGTLFLDEVAELPLSLQPKLLRVIESGEIRRVGDVEARSVDVRVLAATHRDLAQMVESGAFREDLYWRLNVLHLDVPALRERREDIPELVRTFASSVAEREGRGEVEFTPEALEALSSYDWPGNVRQLSNVVERIVTLSGKSRIDADDLPAEVGAGALDSGRPGSAADARMTLEELERAYILEVLDRTGGNKTRAAEWLGIPRRTLYRRLDAYRDDEV